VVIKYEKNPVLLGQSTVREQFRYLKKGLHTDYDRPHNIQQTRTHYWRIKMATISDLKNVCFKGTRVTTALNFTSRVRISLGRVHTWSSCERAGRQTGMKEVSRAARSSTMDTINLSWTGPARGGGSGYQWPQSPSALPYPPSRGGGCGPSAAPGLCPTLHKRPETTTIHFFTSGV